MVVCEDGRMKRSEYKFRICGFRARRGRSRGVRRCPTHGISSGGRRHLIADGSAARIQNDFLAMHEVVHRRYRKLLEEGGPFPDLVLIDGGKGQLSAAYAALEELGLANLVAVGIAKKEELLFMRDHENPIALRTNDPALLLSLAHVGRAHRCGEFHRKARTMGTWLGLDLVPGVGPRSAGVCCSRRLEASPVFDARHERNWQR